MKGRKRVHAVVVAIAFVVITLVSLGSEISLVSKRVEINTSRYVRKTSETINYSRSELIGMSLKPNNPNATANIKPSVPKPSEAKSDTQRFDTLQSMPKTSATNSSSRWELILMSQKPHNANATASFKTFLQEGFVPMRPLEFMHITKTGGTALEAAAAKSGVTWGYCRAGSGKSHCQNAPPPKGGKAWGGQIKRLPRSIPKAKFRRCEEWHTPHHWFRRDYYKRSDTFVVVRNPYARVISEFYSPWGGLDDVCKRSDPRVLNKWIRYRVNVLLQKSNCGHMLPQHYYVFDDSHHQVTTHVLHYENLEVEFQALVNAYKLNISLPPKETYMVGSYVEDSPNCTTTKLTIADLSNETIRIINQLEGPSFNYFGYSRVNSAAEFLEG